MCYHYQLLARAKEIKDVFPHIELENDFYISEYHVNGFDFKAMPIVTQQQPKQLSFYEWGLIPSFAKNWQQAQELRTSQLNAKAETIFEKPSFKTAIVQNRCLVPASGFFDFHELNKKKYPFFISPVEQPLFLFGGICNSWTDPANGKIKNNFSIVTTGANPLMQKIHNTKQRMPLVLSNDAALQWLNAGETSSSLEQLMQPYAEEHMKAHPISGKILKKDGSFDPADITRPYDYPELAFEFGFL